MWCIPASYKFPPNEIPEVYKHIKSTYKAFYDCPYGLCWYYKKQLYSVKFFVRFKGLPSAECTFDKPYEVPKIVESIGDGPDEPVDEDEWYNDYEDEDRPERLEVHDMYGTIIIFGNGHKHIETFCECDAGDIIVPLCSTNYSLFNDGDYEFRTLEEFHQRINANHVVTVDMSDIRRLSRVETQWLVKKVYPIIEGTGLIDEYARNQRLSKIVIPVAKMNKTYIRPMDRDKIPYIEPIYEVQYYLMDWTKHIKDEAAMMRLDYHLSDGDDPLSD